MTPMSTSAFCLLQENSVMASGTETVSDNDKQTYLARWCQHTRQRTAG